MAPLVTPSCARSAAIENVMNRNVLAAGLPGGSPIAATLQVLLLDIARRRIPACARMTRLPRPAGNTNALHGHVGSSHDSPRAIPTLRAGPLAAGSRGGFPIAATLRVLLVDIRVI